jgi:hypothetical protein
MWPGADLDALAADATPGEILAERFSVAAVAGAQAAIGGIMAQVTLRVRCVRRWSVTERSRSGK